MLAVLLLEKGQKFCSIPQIMPKIMLAQSARAYPIYLIDQVSSLLRRAERRDSKLKKNNEDQNCRNILIFIR